MSTKIESDVQRFRQIVRGKIRENLRRYISQGEMIGRQGGDLVSIPVPQLDLPHFRFGNNGRGGVGQGEGEVGASLGPGQESGDPSAGNQPGQHMLEVEVSLDELAEMMADELHLPRIEPKGMPHLEQETRRYNSIRRTGPESLRHFRRTFVQALRRQVTAGTYDYHRPRVLPVKDDQRYRAWSSTTQPHACAAIFYVMDVSGSMTDTQKEIVRTAAFWIDTWLTTQYQGVERRFIIHDASARQVDEQTFYHTRESGGTRISSAYETCKSLIRDQFPVADWNIYLFQFSDGDNWSDDNRYSLHLLEEDLLPACNLICYGQVESPYGSGDYLHTLQERFGTPHPRLQTAEIGNKNDIYDAIRTFLGTGK